MGRLAPKKPLLFLWKKRTIFWQGKKLRSLLHQWKRPFPKLLWRLANFIFNGGGLKTATNAPLLLWNCSSNKIPMLKSPTNLWVGVIIGHHWQPKRLAVTCRRYPARLRRFFQFQQDGLLIPLSPYIDSGLIDLSNVPDDAIAGGMVDGELYASVWAQIPNPLCLTWMSLKRLALICLHQTGHGRF